MFEDFKKKLFFSKMILLFNKGQETGKIVSFEEDFYQQMSDTFFNGIPISMHIKYLKPTSGLGKCYERSLFMFFCFDDALLVRGDVKDLELRFGKENAGHGWIEIGNYVYCPSHLKRFDKELYYKIYNPTNVYKITKEDYIKHNGNYYNEVRDTKIEDFQVGGSRRVDLCVTIPLIKGIADSSDNEEFKRELDKYLTLIQYDEKQIYDEMINQFNSVCDKKIKKV